MTARARSRNTRSAGHGAQCLIAALVALALRGHAIAGDAPPHPPGAARTDHARAGSLGPRGRGRRSVYGISARARAALGFLPPALRVRDPLFRGRCRAGPGTVRRADRSHDVPVVATSPAVCLSAGRIRLPSCTRPRASPRCGKTSALVRPQVRRRFLGGVGRRLRPRAGAAGSASRVGPAAGRYAIRCTASGRTRRYRRARRPFGGSLQ